MGTSIKLFIFFVLGFLWLGSCKETTIDPEVPNNNPYDTVTQFQGLLIPNGGNLQVKLTYTYGNIPLALDSQLYYNLAGDTFTLSLVKRYFSNLSLKSSNGWVNLGNYELVNAEEMPSRIFNLKNVPAGIYTDLSAIIGVDSSRNSGGLQEGALDPAYNMFWTWATGYIFIKVEGTTTKGKTFGLHLGGNASVPNNVIDLRSFKVKTNSPEITIRVDIKELFQNPNIYSLISDGHNVHSPADPSNLKLLQNMHDMLSITDISHP